MATRDNFVQISDGDQLNDGYFNGIYTAIKPSVVYTGTDFDTSRQYTVDGNGTTTNSHTINISANEINTAVIIKILARFAGYSSVGTTNTANTAYATLKIETAENGGSFTSRFDQKMADVYTYDDDNTDKDSSVGTVEFYYEPTSGEKTNGLDIKITSSSYVNSSNASGDAESSGSNIQTQIIYF